MSSAAYQITANYTTPGTIRGLVTGPGVGMDDHLLPLPPFSASFFGPFMDARFSADEAAPCFSGHAVEDESLQYPATRHLLNVPADSSFSGGNVKYTSHWSSDGKSVTVHRELTTHFDLPLCSGKAKDELLSDDLIRQDAQTLVAVPPLAGFATRNAAPAP